MVNTLLRLGALSFHHQVPLHGTFFVALLETMIVRRFLQWARTASAAETGKVSSFIRLISTRWCHRIIWRRL